MAHTLHDLVRRAARIVREAVAPPTHRQGDGLLGVVDDRAPADIGSIVLLAPGGSALAEQLSRLRPAARVLHVAEDPGEAHARLSALGPFDLIVDAGSAPGRRQRFVSSFYQLRPGGMMIVAGAAGELTVAAPSRFGVLLRAAERSRDEPPPSRKRGTPTAVLDAHGLGRAMASVAAAGRHLVAVRSDLTVLAKLRESEMNAYLAARPDDPDTVLETIPAEPFAVRCTFAENTPARRPNFPDHYDTIELSLRLYHDAVVTPGQVLSTDRVITPDSYRHNQFARLRNRYTTEVAHRFATLSHGTDDLPYLSGTYFYLDNELRGHFGHLMTEQLSRFWAWSRARERYPDARALVAINKGHDLRSWESEIYAAGGIPPEDVVLLREPVRVERVVSGTPMLSNPDYVHPAIADTWRAVGDRLEAGSTPLDVPPRIFCSRRLAKRSCHNTEDVEAIFAEHGFAIVFPEDYSLGQQVQLFRRAEVIGGFVGSGLFTLCYALDPKRVITVGSTAYTARNEYLIAAVLGHRIDSVACVPDDPTFYQSPFTFDPDHDGRYLRGVLAAL